jgi:nitroreductase
MRDLKKEALNERKPSYNISRFITQRWSPRAMTPELLESDLLPLFESARWAPSSGNNQSWRFIYSLNNSSSWLNFFNLLTPGNKEWCKNAGALLLILSKKTRISSSGEEKPQITHSFETGMAYENLALQAAENNLVCHGMAGFDYEKAKTEFNIPETYQVEAMAAIGHPAEPGNPETPSQRNPISSFTFKDNFKE